MTRNFFSPNVPAFGPVEWFSSRLGDYQANVMARMWGISHFDIRHGRIVEEWTMFNEFSTLQQILRADPLPGAT